MPKTTKNTKTAAKSKVVVGGKKPVAKWKIGFLGLALLTLITAVGYVGYDKYQEHRLTAKAAGWATVYDKDGYKIQVCKYSTPYGYGVQALFAKPANTGTTMRGLSTFRTSSTNSDLVANKWADGPWYNNEVSLAQAYIYPDGWYKPEVVIRKPYAPARLDKYVGPGMLSMAFTPTC